MSELRKLMDNVLAKKYPELLNKSIDIEYNKLDSHWIKFDEIPMDGYLIELDEELKGASDSVKTGFIASALSQIMMYGASSLDGKRRYDSLEAGSEEEIIKNEIATDNETISRGFGNELYAAAKFLEERNYKEDGISLKELELIRDNAT